MADLSTAIKIATGFLPTAARLHTSGMGKIVKREEQTLFLEQSSFAIVTSQK